MKDDRFDQIREMQRQQREVLDRLSGVSHEKFKDIAKLYGYSDDHMQKIRELTQARVPNLRPFGPDLERQMLEFSSRMSAAAGLIKKTNDAWMREAMGVAGKLASSPLFSGAIESQQLRQLEILNSVSGRMAMSAMLPLEVLDQISEFQSRASMAAIGKIDWDKLALIGGKESLLAERLRNQFDPDAYASRVSEKFITALEDVDERNEVLAAVREVIATELRSGEGPSEFTTYQKLMLIIAVLTLLATSVGVLLQNVGSVSSKEPDERRTAREQDNSVETEQIIRLLEEIENELGMSDLSKNSVTLYKTDRETRVYPKPSTKSAAHSSVDVHITVRVLRRKHKWVYIESFDYLTGKAISGWVMKKYLKKIKY